MYAICAVTLPLWSWLPAIAKKGMLSSGFEMSKTFSNVCWKRFEYALLWMPAPSAQAQLESPDQWLANVESHQ